MISYNGGIKKKMNAQDIENLRQISMHQEEMSSMKTRVQDSALDTLMKLKPSEIFTADESKKQAMNVAMGEAEEKQVWRDFIDNAKKVTEKIWLSECNSLDKLNKEFDEEPETEVKKALPVGNPNAFKK